MATAENQTKTAVGASPTDIKGKIIEFLWQLERNGRTKTTIKGYNKLLNRCLKHNINLFDPEEVKGYIAKAPLKSGTKRLFAGMFKVWYRFLKIPWEPPKYISQSEIPFIPTEQELDQFIAACGKKTAAFLQILKETGARPGEILRFLKWTDIDFQQKTIRITPLKGSLPRILPLSIKAIEMLNNLPKKSEKVFATKIHSNFQIQRKRIAKKLGNPRLLKITLRTFRHWKGTMEYHKSTGDIMYVKEILGHKTVLSTQVYVHIAKALFQNAPPEEYHVKIAKTPEEITQLLEAGFEYVCQKDGLAFFRKRK